MNEITSSSRAAASRGVSPGSTFPPTQTISRKCSNVGLFHEIHTETVVPAIHGQRVNLVEYGRHLVILN